MIFVIVNNAFFAELCRFRFEFGNGYDDPIKPDKSPHKERNNHSIYATSSFPSHHCNGGPIKDLIMVRA